MTVQIAVRRLPHNTDLPLPAYATAGAAGMDLLAAVEAPVTIDPGRRALIPTGIAIALPPGYELQIRPRSGLALRRGIVLPNSPGTIEAFTVAKSGDRAERGRGAVYRRARRAYRPGGAGTGGARPLAWVGSLDATTRNEGGFGSTGH
jgi:dUTP pyrophosphatase